MADCSQFPPDEQYGGKHTETPGVEAPDHNQRRTHHHKVPVVNTAGGTATIVHPNPLKRTIKQNTDDVAHSIGGTEQ